MPASLADLRQAHSPDFRAFLERTAKRVQPLTIIDVGASNGCWSVLARDVWPQANLVCIEANPMFTAELSHVLRVLGGAVMYTSLAYDKAGATDVHFHEDQPFQDVMDGIWPRGVNINTITLDDAATFPGPYLVKLDVHGREHRILEGAKRVLAETVGIVAELYAWPVGDESMRMLDLLPIFRAKGFEMTDICNLFYRPLDGRLCSIDALLEPMSAKNMGPGWA